MWQDGRAKSTCDWPASLLDNFVRNKKKRKSGHEVVFFFPNETPPVFMLGVLRVVRLRRKWASDEATHARQSMGTGTGMGTGREERVQAPKPRLALAFSVQRRGGGGCRLQEARSRRLEV